MVTGAVGVAAYEALRKMVVKAPLRAATVSVATGFNVDAVRAVAIVARTVNSPSRRRPGVAVATFAGWTLIAANPVAGMTAAVAVLRQRGHPPSSRPGRIRR